ncbi:hypothetical protein BPAE_0327g00010 [Botrytis paeoniae]|uniref:Uncharacterized protein n=1 Tax=Botrytis paeoniae TaxID=278948 RepID=A0A4Z1F9G5_9HELO|nr:hypothetical protein BPAE_0327g00010 [Botrytis paeoniae]
MSTSVILQDVTKLFSLGSSSHKPTPTIQAKPLPALQYISHYATNQQAPTRLDGAAVEFIILENVVRLST